MTVKVYTKNACGYCNMAKNLLKSKNITFEEVNIDDQPEAREFVINEGHRTMPQIYINEKNVGGFDQLKTYDLSNIQ
jgi:GrxC family glutaredoxin|tara:strand:+ start:5436 stop:5666 length:231 start_codon:yes stop_codon:yes gene_type:complete